MVGAYFYRSKQLFLSTGGTIRQRNDTGQRFITMPRPLYLSSQHAIRYKLCSAIEYLNKCHRFKRFQQPVYLFDQRPYMQLTLLHG